MIWFKIAEEFNNSTKCNYPLHKTLANCWCFNNLTSNHIYWSHLKMNGEIFILIQAIRKYPKRYVWNRSFVKVMVKSVNSYFYDQSACILLVEMFFSLFLLLLTGSRFSCMNQTNFWQYVHVKQTKHELKTQQHHTVIKTKYTRKTNKKTRTKSSSWQLCQINT